MTLNIAESTVVFRLSAADQEKMIDEARSVIEKSPLVRPRTPSGLLMRVRVTAAGKLGWVGDGAYHYSREDSSGNPWPEMPPSWSELATRVAGNHPWDSAIINWYSPGASLGWHRDQSERNSRLPIVTVSLGDAARWSIKRSPGEPVDRCTLVSGDVTLLAGPTRAVLHSIERIIEQPLLSPLSKPGRLSITIRVAG